MRDEVYIVQCVLNNHNTIECVTTNRDTANKAVSRVLNILSHVSVKATVTMKKWENGQLAAILEEHSTQQQTLT